MTTARALCLLPAVLLGVACGAPPAPPVPTTTQAPTTPPAPTTTTKPPYTPPAGPLTAKNGRDLKACAKGNCEVIVKKDDQIWFNAAVDGPEYVVVTSVTDAELHLYAGAGRNGGLSGGMSGALGGGEFVEMTRPARNGKGESKLVFAVGDGKDGSAVLRLTHTTE